MIPIMALRAVLLAVLAGVQGLSVVSAGDRTNILIETDAAVTFEHQMLSSPPRIVVDIKGSEFQLPQRRFLDINRGGVLALRSSQYQEGVVRVVVDLAEAVDYQIEQSEDVVLVSFANASGEFDAWSSSAGTMEDTEMPEPEADAAETEPEPMADPEPVRAEPQRADQAAARVPVSRPAVQEAPAPRQPRITVEFREVPIVDVLNTFADFSGRSIVPGQGVQQQTITAAIREQPWDEAMRAILEGQGLTANELQSGIIMVTSLQNQRQLEAQEKTVTEAFQLQYVSADSVAPQVRELLAQGAAGGQPEAGQQRQSQGSVAVNRATNSIIVSARQSVVDGLRELIPSLDRRTPQVTVQVRILSVRRSDFEGLGVHYEFKETNPPGNQLNRLTPGWIDSDGDGILDDGEEVDPPTDVVSLTGSSISAMGNALERIPQATFEVLSTLMLGSHALMTWIDAVERLELAELQADPVVTVLDHRTARVHVGERTPLRVVDQGSQGDQGPQATVRTEETGVILELTPHVVGSDQVFVQLHAERSEIQSFSADAGYVFGTQQTDTEILLNDGQTAVISGLTTTDLRDTKTGIPILMHLPLVGGLFRNTYVTEEKEDLLIMVTPYIERAEGF